MISLPFAAGRTYGVMGLDKSGLPAVQALLASGAQVLAWDDNPQQLEAARALGAQIVDLATADVSSCTALVLTPGIAHSLPKAHPVAVTFVSKPIICDIELFALSRPSAKIIGITGTDGKSTTTALIGHILQHAGVPCALGGNFGQSPLLLPVLPAQGVYVLELSSYQLERCPSLAVDIGIWLNLTPDHLERHGDMAGYAAAKNRLWQNHKTGALAIYGTEDEWTQSAGQAAGARGWQAVPISAALVQEGIDLTTLPALQGAHNRQNASAALLACRALGLSAAQIDAGLRSFAGLPHRQQLIAERGKLRFINDSKATNANAASKALGTFSEIYWIAGGRAKIGGLSGLEGYIPRIRKAYLIGEAQEEFAQWCSAHHLPHARCGTLAQALAQAVEDAQGAGTILLSPAAASLDQFSGYEQRGQAFAALVSTYLGALKGAA